MSTKVEEADSLPLPKSKYFRDVEQWPYRQRTGLEDSITPLLPYCKATGPRRARFSETEYPPAKGDPSEPCCQDHTVTALPWLQIEIWHWGDRSKLENLPP